MTSRCRSNAGQVPRSCTSSGSWTSQSLPFLASALHGLEQPCERIVLEFSGLQFIDSTGLCLAFEENQRAAADGFEFVIAGSGENVLRVLRIAGLDVALPLAPDVASVIDDGDRR